MRRNFILFDSTERKWMYPFSLIRPVADCRVGIWTIREKWEKGLGLPVSTHTNSFLDEFYPTVKKADNIWINSGLLPNPDLLTAIGELSLDTALVSGQKLLAVRSTHSPLVRTSFTQVNFNGHFDLITFPWDIFRKNRKAIVSDFAGIQGRNYVSDLSDSNHLNGKENIFVAEGAKVNGASINATDGPVFIDRDAVIMEGSLLYGPVSVGEGAVVKMGAKIYGATTVGPHSIVGGEIKNSVIFGYSNKAHDGYLGDSIIGEWCNWGAGTSCSNLKNSAGEIEVNLNGTVFPVGIKCGVLFGDYSRTAIHSRINSGTVIGISCHLIQPDFPPKNISSFSWGTTRYEKSKVIGHIDNWMRLKNRELEEKDKAILMHIYDQEDILF